MVKDDSDRLSVLRQQLRQRLGNERYELWLGPQTSLSLEGAGLRLVESVFRSHPSLAVRRIMKVHYPRLQQSARIMQRLSRRDHAA